MQASTRIGIALCVLVTGATLAGLFRKLPEPVVSPADRSESQLTLRQPGQTPVMAASGGGWRTAGTETPKNTEGDQPRRSPDRPPLVGVKIAGRASAAPPLPVPTMPEVASSDSLTPGLSSSPASGDLWNAKMFRPAIPLALGPDRSREAASAADDDWQLHEVADGDTLAKLAQRYYGDTALAEAIQRANPALLKNAEILPIGAFLKIPSRGTAAPATTGRVLPVEGWRKAPGTRP